MRGVDHNPVGFAGFARQLGEDAVEHPQAAPADEAVVDGLVRTVTRASRHIKPCLMT